MHTIDTIPQTSKHISKKLILGFAALIAAAVVGTTSSASAHGWHGWKPQHKGNDKHHGWWHKPKPGHGGGWGYGGNHNVVNSDVNVAVNGDNNIVHVVINYIFN